MSQITSNEKSLKDSGINKQYIYDVITFISYILVGTLIPHLMFEIDPTSPMAYCIVIGPVSFAILGLITTLYNRNIKHSLIASALTITPILIYFEIYTSSSIYVWEIVFYALFVLTYSLMSTILRINKGINKFEVLYWKLIGVMLFLSCMYINLCVISLITYNESYSVPIYTEPLQFTFIFIVPIFVGFVLLKLFKRKIERN